MKLIVRDPDLVIFPLIIGFLLPIILIFIVENSILRHVFLVITLSFLSGFLFHGVFRIIEKKDLGLYLFLTFLCGLFMPLIFSLIHELSHAITAISLGIDVTRIEIYYPMGGITHLAKGSNFTNRENIAIMINLSGSLGSVLSTVSIIRIIYHFSKTSVASLNPLSNKNSILVANSS